MNRIITIGREFGSGGIRRQDIYICYGLVGFIPVDTLEKQETA